MTARERSAPVAFRQHGLAIVILLTLALAYHAPVLLAGETYYGDDILYEHFPNAVFARQRLAEGHLPLWNPYQLSGFPFLADSVTQTLYPPLWLLLLVGPKHVMGYIILHYFVAGCTMYACCRQFGIASLWASLTASVAFMFSGFALLQLNNIIILCAYAWIPLAMLLADRAAQQSTVRSGVLLGLGLALQLLSGGLQLFAGTLYFAVAYVLFGILRQSRKELRWRQLLGEVVRVGAGGAVGLSVTAIQMVPSWELAQQSVRAGGVAYETASTYSLLPKRLLSLFAPRIWPLATWPEVMEVGNGQLGYVGIATLLLAATWELENAAGYSQLRPRNYDRLWSSVPLTRTLQLLNVQYVLSNSPTDVPSAFSPAFQSGGVYVSLTSARLPRAFVVSRWRGAADEEVLDLLAQSAFDPTTEVLLADVPPPCPTLPDGEQESGAARIVRHEPERIDLAVTLPHEGVLVLSEPWFAGWECQVNGQLARIWRANGILRAVILPPGSHWVSFRYEPSSVYLGGVASAVGLLASAGLALLKGVRPSSISD